MDLRTALRATHDASGVGQDWKGNLEAVVVAALQALNLERLCLYSLHLHSGSYMAVPAVSMDPCLESLPHYPDPSWNGSPRAQLLRSVSDNGLPGRDAATVVIPICRGTDVLYLIELLDTDREIYLERDGESLAAIFAPLRATYTERRLSKMLKFAREPIDYRLKSAEFLDELSRILLRASGMTSTALRELRGGHLKCLGAWGFERMPTVDDLSWPVTEYEAFSRAARDGKTTQLNDPNIGDLLAIRRIPGLEEVRTFLTTPVRVGQESFGVLSFATRCQYHFPASELSALETLGNIVGVALAHYRNTHGALLSKDEFEGESIRTTALEIATSARHEAKAQIDDLIELSSDEDDNPVLPPDLQDSLLELSATLDKIRVAMVAPAYVRTTRNIRDVWNDAVEQLTGRLDYLKIAHRYPGASVSVSMYYDWLRLAFVHLLLNSIDAFAGKGRGVRRPLNNNRLIRLVVDRPNVKEKIVTMRYSDNATGMSPLAVKSDARFDHLPFEQRVFSPGASSKGTEGSGQGLFLIRRAIDEHRGSVELEDYSRQGTTFKIELPLE